MTNPTANVRMINTPGARRTAGVAGRRNVFPGSRSSARHWLLTGGLAAAFAVAQVALGQAPANTYRYRATDTVPAGVATVHADRRVTFRLRAPASTRVELSLAGQGSRAMQRGTDGTWTTTVGPLEPEIHQYHFVVDGVQVAPVAGPLAKIGRSSSANLLEIPGSPPRFDEAQDVPRGALHVRHYHSTVLNLRRRLHVYLPPQYDAEPARRFPVLYLRHGNGDMEWSWSEVGRGGVILDNLLAQQKATPMIIVMPNGYAGDVGSTPAAIEATARELLEEIIPFVERSYRVRGEREHRAIAGLSMGGGQAFLTGLRHLDRFAWVAEFASGVLSDVDFRLERAVPGFLEVPTVANERLRLLFLSCGTEDPRYAGQLALRRSLEQHGIRHVWFSTAGGHEWKVWRRSLAQLLPQLFQPAGGSRTNP